MRASIGQDSHRFAADGTRGCILAGVVFYNAPAILANSDGDVVYHALTNAVSGITCKNILGGPADEMCRAGITDSSEYLKAALRDLNALGYRAENISVSIECLTPRITPAIDKMRANIAELFGIECTDVGITATTGENLTDCGRGLGVSVFCILTAEKI